MDDFIHAASPVLAVLAVLLVLWLIRRYLFARNCWRCGFQLTRIKNRREPLLGFVKLAQCRRCGANSIKLL